MKKLKVLFALGFFLLALSGYSERAIEGKVIFLIGKVQINGKKAQLGMILKSKDVITTDKTGICQILIGDKTIIQIGKASKINFSLLSGERKLFMEQGSIGAVLNKGQERKEYVIRTPALTAGVRGTSFYVEARTNHQSYFCVCNGVIYLEPLNKKAKGEEIKSSHHTARVFTKQKDGKINVSEGSLENHDDKTIESLAEKIGVKIDWTQPD